MTPPDTRERILEAARDAFARDSYDRTSAAAICRTARVSSGTFFHWFPRKLDLLLGILGDDLDDLERSLLDWEATDPGVPALLAQARAYATEIGGPGFSHQLSMVAGVEQLPEVASLLARESRMLDAFLQRQLDHAIEVGDLMPATDTAQLRQWLRWIIDGAASGVATGQAADVDSLPDAVSVLLSRDRG